MFLNKYNLAQHQLLDFLYKMFVQNIFFARFGKNIILVFFGFMLNIHVLQYEASALRQFCRPVLERDKIIKTESTRKSSNIYLSWTKIEYQNNFNPIALFSALNKR